MRNLLAEQPDLDGVLVTMDALHATGETLAVVKEKHADFLVSVKANRPALRTEALEELARLPSEDILGGKDNPKTAHGRVETRSIRVFPFVSDDQDFASVKTAMVVHRRTRIATSGRVTEEDELYVSSVYYSAKSTKRWLTDIRGHWHIENGLHHTKDRTMKEDRCVAQGTSAVNMSTLRSLTVHLLRSCARFAPNASDAFKANSQKAVDLVLGGVKRPIK